MFALHINFEGAKNIMLVKSELGFWRRLKIPDCWLESLSLFGYGHLSFDIPLILVLAV